MAKAPAPPAADAAAPRKSGKMKLLIIIAVIVIVLLIAGAAVIGLLLLKKGGGDDAGAAAVAPVATMDLTRPPTFAPLDPFVVNLAPGEGERYLQVVLALQVADTKTADNLKGFMPAIRHRINLLLSNRLPSELSSLEGREALAEQMTDEVNQVLGAPPSADGKPSGPVRAVLFNSFIIQ